MEEFEAILEGLAEKYDRQFEQLDVNIAFEALGSTPPKDCSECPVHSRVNVHDYNPTAGIEAMYAVTYVGDYAVYTDDDTASLPQDPFVLGQMLAMSGEELSDVIGYVVKVYYVGNGPIQDDSGIAPVELALRTDSCVRANMLHDDTVEALREGANADDLRDLYNQ